MKPWTCSDQRDLWLFFITSGKSKIIIIAPSDIRSWNQWRKKWVCAICGA